VLPGGAVLGDLNGDGMIRADDGEITNPLTAHQVCMHLAAGDGFITMADGLELYIFSFSNVTGVPEDQVMTEGAIAANFPAPTIDVREGDEFYLTLTNVGMAMRPDLFDAHSVHFHGFPQAAPVFDGLPEASATVNMGSSLTYYYKIVIPGTYIYHCHVEASEHMQMGMLGNLFVRPAQDNNGALKAVGTSRYPGAPAFAGFAYNDGDGSTGYDRQYAIQLGSMDSNFHIQHLAIQPLPFAYMKDDYAMFNGRGYPDTVDPAPLPPPPDNGGKISQPVSSAIQASVGERVLLRLSSLDVTRFFTVGVMGIPMRVVGYDARLLNANLRYDTTSVTLGGGQTTDVVLDTTNVAPGTYYLYTTNLNYLSNGPEDFGGMMTEIVVTP
jgi:FtsP/CotA-like multicopper oxidase with cupredoxin domain